MSEETTLRIKVNDGYEALGFLDYAQKEFSISDQPYYKRAVAMTRLELNKQKRSHAFTSAILALMVAKVIHPIFWLMFTAELFYCFLLMGAAVNLKDEIRATDTL